MRTLRVTTAAVLCLIAATSAGAQCVSDVRQLELRSSFYDVVPGPVAVGGGVLVFVSTQLGSDDVWVSIYDASGVTRFSSVMVPDATGSQLIDLIWNGTEFALFYRLPDKSLTLARITPQGEVIGPTTPLPKIVLEDGHGIDILWDPVLRKYLVARTVTTGSAGVWLTYLEADGRLTASDLLEEAQPQSLLEIVRLEGGDLAIFFSREGEDTLFYMRVRDGSPLFVVPVWTVEDELLVAARGDEIALLKTEEADGGRGFVWKIIDTTGNLVQDEEPIHSREGRDLQPLAFMANGAEFALTYYDAPGEFDLSPRTFRLRRFDRNGTVLSDTLMNAAGLTFLKLESNFDFIWTGSAYVTAASLREEGLSESFLLRYCPLWTEIAGPATARRNEDVRFTALVDGGVPGYSYRWSWGGGNVATGSQPFLRFDGTGDVLVTVEVTDATGTVVRDTVIVTVTGGSRRRAVRK